MEVFWFIWLDSLNNSNLFFSQFWRLEVQDQGTVRFGFSGGLSAWLIDGCLLIVFIGHLLVCVLIPLPTHQLHTHTFVFRQGLAV
jgi:hypothetical protein